MQSTRSEIGINSDKHISIVVARPFAASVTWFPEREFDNLIEELLYRRFFGDVSEFLLPYFTEINQTFTVGQFEIEVIGAIALEGRRSSQVWHTYEGAYRDFVIETVFVPIVDSNVFVAIRDLNG